MLGGSPSLDQDWSGQCLYMFPPSTLQAETCAKIELTQHMRGAAVFLLTQEMKVERYYFGDGASHFPPYIQWSGLRLVQFKSTHMTTKFTSSYHRILLLFVDKNVINNDLASRCSKYLGHCQECPGNPNMYPAKTMYFKPYEKDFDHITRLF